MLWKIKQLILKGDYWFTDKALSEMYVSGITKEDVLEAIINAHGINKVLKTTSRGKTHKGERIYVIYGFTYDNILLYTKGTIKITDGEETMYRLISAKREGIF